MTSLSNMLHHVDNIELQQGAMVGIFLNNPWKRRWCRRKISPRNKKLTNSSEQNTIQNTQTKNHPILNILLMNILLMKKAIVHVWWKQVGIMYEN